MRLRQKNDVYYLTLKADGGITRLEREAEITKVQFDTFWPQTDGRRVEKVRWTGALSDGLSYELDLFDGELAGLQMVEVEFPSEDAAHDFVPPDWFGADVTHDKRYKNKSLALKGLPTGD